MGFSGLEYWSEFLFPLLGDLPGPGTKPGPCVSSIGKWLFTPRPPGESRVKLTGPGMMISQEMHLQCYISDCA